MTLFLWDASDYDWDRGPMDLRAAKADGIVGFTHKFTEATWIKHTHSGEAVARARDAGMEFVGAYHVVRSTSPAEQVDYFLSYLDAVAPWWRTFPGFFLQVDLENWPYDHVTAATGLEFTRQLIAAQPKKVILYASRGQYGDQLTGSPAPLWNANYGSNPVAHYLAAYPGDASSRWTAYSGQTPALLQYGSQLTIGTQPICDANAFRGTINDLRTLLGVAPTATAPKGNAEMFRLIDPEGGQFVISPDTLSSTGWSYEPIVDPVGPIGRALVAAGIGTANGNPNDPAHDPYANNQWRPGTFGPHKTDVRAKLIADVAAAVVAALPPAGGGSSGPTVTEIAEAVADELHNRLSQ
jgi:hypothetical protein